MSAPGSSGITAEAFSMLQSNNTGATSALTGDDPTNGVNPFNIAIVDTNSFTPGSPLYLGLDFSVETGTDGTISNVEVTDIGVVPEPTGVAILGAGALGMLVRRRKAQRAR